MRLPGMGFPSLTIWMPQIALFAGANRNAPGLPPWRGGILAVKSQPRKLKGPEAFALPAHAISTKNKHLLVIYSIPTRGFTAAVSVFRGTPPPKPLECKFWLNTMGALFCDRWADPTCGEPRLSCARFNLVSVDIIKMSPSFRSQIVHLSLSVIQGNKKTLLTLR